MRQSILIFSIVAATFISSFAGENEYSPYYKLGEFEGDISAYVKSVKNALTSKNFRVIGEYQPGSNNDLYVVCYTQDDLEKISLDFPDRGALAATLKVGFKKQDKKVTVSMLNPIYMFYAYFNDNIKKHEAELIEISESAKLALKSVGQNLTPFGGSLTKEKLQKYHYKIMMPYFKDAEDLATFASFEEGVKTIRENLEVRKGITVKVYELVYPDKKIAVFGVGLLDAEKGESHFLPIIGDEHVSAMPYELILQGNKATMLPGRYRIALHWPDLTMGTFMKIMSTPGEINDILKELTR